MSVSAGGVAAPAAAAKVLRIDAAGVTSTPTSSWLCGYGRLSTCRGTSARPAAAGRRCTVIAPAEQAVRVGSCPRRRVSVGPSGKIQYGRCCHCTAGSASSAPASPQRTSRLAAQWSCARPVSIVSSCRLSRRSVGAATPSSPAACDRLADRVGHHRVRGHLEEHPVRRRRSPPPRRAANRTGRAQVGLPVRAVASARRTADPQVPCCRAAPPAPARSSASRPRRPPAVPRRHAGCGTRRRCRRGARRAPRPAARARAARPRPRLRRSTVEVGLAAMRGDDVDAAREPRVELVERQRDHRHRAAPGDGLERRRPAAARTARHPRGRVRRRRRRRRSRRPSGRSPRPA